MKLGTPNGRSALLELSERRSPVSDDRVSAHDKEGEPSRWRLYMAVFICSLRTLSSGLSVGYTSPALPGLQEHLSITDAQRDWFSSLLTIGGIVGSVSAGKCCRLHVALFLKMSCYKLSWIRCFHFIFFLLYIEDLVKHIPFYLIRRSITLFL